MRVFYLDEPLQSEDLRFVADSLSLDVIPKQVRIPYVLPMLADGRDYDKECTTHERLIRKHLRKAGVHKEREQVILVVPTDVHWHSILVRAIHSETGAYPYLVQTSTQRKAIGNPGSTRILDAQGLMGIK